MKKKTTGESLNEFTQDPSELTSSKVEVLASLVFTLGYSLTTLASILAVEEEEQALLATEKSQDQNKYIKQMYKQLQQVNNRLDSIERKINRY